MYDHDPERAPDDDFEPATWERLTAGRGGRLLDPRRTPIRVVSVEPEVGLFEVEVLAFEDAGARWRIPLERSDRFQLARGGGVAPPSQVAACRAAVERFARPLRVAVDPVAAARTAERLERLERAAATWLGAESRFVASGDALPLGGPIGDPRLQGDLRRWLAEADLVDLDRAFTRAWVSAPWRAGVVEGHRLVAAELGLCAFEGAVVREPDLFDGGAGRARRAEHLLRRMAFVRALLRGQGHASVVLYRGLTSPGALAPPPRHGLLSATFRRELAEAHFDARPTAAGMLVRQPVPIERLVMTYLETAAMNAPYQEAEALLLADPEAVGF